MFSLKKFSILYKTLQKTQRFTSVEANLGGPIGNLFFRSEIQELLEKIVNVPIDQVYRTRKEGKSLKPPKYEFMTDNELQEAEKRSRERAKHWLQMPPVLDPYVPEPKLITQDKALDGHDRDQSTHIFTDISYGVPETQRFIVVREPSGDLRYADHLRVRRIHQIYTPRNGRELEAPAMFFEPHLTSLLDREEYQFVLDRACAQFEPDDPDFVRICSVVFERVAERGHFQHLAFTRHFGPLILRLVAAERVDDCLEYFLGVNRLAESTSLVRLHRLIKGNADEEQSHLLENYVQKKPKLNALFNAARARLQEEAERSIKLDEIHEIARN